MASSIFKARILCAAALALCWVSPVSAQDKEPGANLLAKGRYQELNQLPDWSGVWENLTGWVAAKDKEAPNAPDNRPPYNAEYAKKYAVVEAAAAAGKPINDPTANCVWPGVPRIAYQPYGQEFLFSPGRVTMLYSIYSNVRRIFTDGRKHPADLDPSFNGHSIGHWEGDTLVVETKGLRADTMLDMTGMPHSDAMEVRERWRLVGPDRLEAQVSIIDPKALTRPYVTIRHFKRHREWDMPEYVCEENNRNPVVNGVTQTIVK